MDAIKCIGGGGGEVVLFPSLKKLVLSEMGSLEEWVDIVIPSTTTTVSYSCCFPFLEKIKIYCCPKLRITPTRFPSLKKLNLEKINERVAVPLITTNISSLESIQLVNISELMFLPHRLLQGCSNLKEFKAFDCVDFQGFLPHEEEEELQQQPIQHFSLFGLPALKFLPDIRSFTSLETLYIHDCGSFKPSPEDLTCLSSSLEKLKRVHIQNVKEVEDFIREK